METTRAVVQEFLVRLGDGDADGIAELFAAAVDWRLDWPAGEHPAVPWIRAREGRADVAEHFRSIAAHHEPGGGGAVDGILVDGADSVVFAEIKQVAKATGTAYTARCALRFTVESGLITRYHAYEDSLSVARAFGVA